MKSGVAPGEGDRLRVVGIIFLIFPIQSASLGFIRDYANEPENALKYEIRAGTYMTVL